MITFTNVAEWERARDAAASVEATTEGDNFLHRWDILFPKPEPPAELARDIQREREHLTRQMLDAQRFYDDLDTLREEVNAACQQAYEAQGAALARLTYHKAHFGDPR